MGHRQSRGGKPREKKKLTEGHMACQHRSWKELQEPEYRPLPPPPPGLSGFTMSAQGESAATGKSRCRGNPGGESGTSQPPDTNGVWVWLLLTGSSKGEGRREATGATPLMFTSGLPSRPVGSTPGWGEAACREVPAEIKPALHPCPRLVPHGGPDASLPPASPRASS